ncbi:MAG: Asp-tRNA(Asn)/Glu-tRNA(Gln) amidotransferase subunit GatC [Pseudomonadota bacterium]
MSLNLQEVQRIAQLARIETSPAQAEHTLTHLQQVFTLIEAMQTVDTQGISPMAHAQDLGQRLRDDGVTEATNEADMLAQRALFQSIAPETEAGLYLLPQVIE